eukprot:scaffold630919_cov23-Prasinocladus_malaysianus.AAC.1
MHANMRWLLTKATSRLEQIVELLLVGYRKIIVADSLDYSSSPVSSPTKKMRKRRRSEAETERALATMMNQAI